jgi:uncharacterized membrane protein YciS (DUF1049 family)
MRIFTYILLIIILIFGVTFACLNAQPALLNFYFGKYSLPLSLLLAITLFLGCLLGMLASSISLLKEKTKNVRLQHRVKLAEQELANLRTIPLKDNSIL